QLGNRTINSTDTNAEAGTGYFKETIAGSEVEAEMGKIKVQIQSNSKNTGSSSWGSVYWQYFEDLDKINVAKTGLHLEKKLFIQKNGPAGPVLHAIADGQKLKIGDRVIVRIVLRADRDME